MKQIRVGAAFGVVFSVVLVLGQVIAQDISALQPVSNPPESGTFFLLSAEASEGSPPYPFDPYFGLMPIYQLPGLPNQYVIGDTSEDFQALQSLQLSLRSGDVMTMDGGLPDFPPEGEEGGGGGEWGTNYLGWVFGTNDLWLELESASLTNGTGNLVMHIPEIYTNSVWDVFGTRNLAVDFPGLNGTNWTWVARTEAGVTNVFVSLLSDYQSYYRIADTNDLDSDSLTDAFELLVSHSDPATNDTDGDSLLDGWSWIHFGSAYGSASNNTGATDDYDGDGVSNVDEQTAGSDPNSITFTAHLGYGQTSVTNPTATISVLSGVPSYYAVIVDSTNFNNPKWQTFTTNPVVSFPDSDGEHLVWVLLRGRVNATAWLGFGATLDRIAPPIVLTGGTDATNSKPVIQVTGYSTDAVSSVSCTLSNASGTESNLSGFVTEQDFGSVTTNYYQVFDVELTNGVNALTLRVSDLAGNMTTSNFNVTFDTAGDSNAPVLMVLWPKDGSRLGADSFTLRARLDDETASVTASVVSSSGATNGYYGTVERNGAVWIEDIVLEAGTNFLTLTAVDAATNSTATNLMLIRSDVQVTIQEPGGLNAHFTSVSGTVSDGSYSVWVNGIQATVSGTNWSAETVPLGAGGSASITTTVIPPGGITTNSAGGEDPAQWNPTDPDAVQVSIQPEKPAEVKLVHGEWSQESRDNVLPPDESPGLYLTQHNWRYDEKAGGYAERITTSPASTNGVQYWLNPDGTESYATWQTTPVNVVSTNWFELHDVFWQDFNINGPMADGMWLKQNSGSWGDSVQKRSAKNVDVELRTGGRGGQQNDNLIEIEVTAFEKVNDDWRNVPLDQVITPNFSNLDNTGSAFAAMADNTKAKITPQAPGAYKEFTYSKQKYKQFSRTVWPALTNTNRSRTKLGVGEEIDLGFSPTPWFVFDWTTTAGSLSSAMSAGTRLTATSNAISNITVKATLRGERTNRTMAFPPFKVVEPANATSIIESNQVFSAGYQGAGMYLKITWHPTDVSFYRVQTLELPGPATNITGFFTNYAATNLAHFPNTNWITLLPDNSYRDLSGLYGYPPPWYPGGFDFDIPIQWRIIDSSIVHDFTHALSQKRITSTNGTTTVSKLGSSTSRTP